MNKIQTIRSITEAHALLGLEKPKHPLVSLWQHRVDHTKSALGDQRFALDLYIISLKEGVTGSMGYGRNAYDFEEGTMIFTSPGQVIGSGETESSGRSTGWSLMFHPDLIRKSRLGSTIDDYSFFSYNVNEALHLSDEEKRSVTDLVSKIEREYSQHIDKHSQKLMVANIELLLDYCTRYYDRQFFVRSDFNKDIATKFTELIKNYYKSGKALLQGVPSVGYCGKELNISPNYLSDLLKKETGRNAREQIQDFLINRAKTNLLNSSESISEIAHTLGFEYPQHFSKIFKNKTGMSPREYRNLN